MRYFTDSPYERMMMQIPRSSRGSSPPPRPPRKHPCYGCKNRGKKCTLPCERGVVTRPNHP